MLYCITRITYLDGTPIIAIAHNILRRIGRKGYFNQMVIGKPLLFRYAAPATGTLKTSPVSKIQECPDYTIQVTTQRNIYYFQEEEPREPYWTYLDME